MKWLKDCIHEYIEQTKNIQVSLLEYIDDEANSDTDFQFLDNQFILCNRYKFKTLLSMIIQISNNRLRQANFFDKIEKILDHIKNYIQKHFTNYEIFKIFESNKRILLFLINSKILILNDQIISDIKTNDYLKNYFSPEIGLQDDDLLKNPEYFEENRKNGENESYICKLIREDSIDTFIAYLAKTSISFTSTINPSFFETNSFLINKTPSLIEYASFYGSIQIFNYLLSKGVKLTSTLWLYSIHSNNAEIIQILEENQIKPDDFSEVCKESIKCFYRQIEEHIKDNYLIEKVDMTYLHFQFYNFDFDIEEISDIKSLFFAFVKSDYPYFVDLFLQKKIDCFVNEYLPPIKDDESDDVEYTPLIYSCDKGHFDMVDVLLKFNNIDVNKLSRTISGVQKTAFYVSVERENILCIKKLINKDDTDVNIPSIQEYIIGDFSKNMIYSPLFIAVKKGNIEIIKILLKQSYIDINFVNKLSYVHVQQKKTLQNLKITSLYYAVRNKNIEIIKLLLKHKDIEVNNINRYYDYMECNDEETCLYRAVYTMNHEIFNILLSKNSIDLNCNLNDGNKTALYCAIDNNDMEIVKALLSSETIDVNAKSDVFGGEKTPLFYAITMKNIEVIKLLLAHQNIDVNALNSWTRFNETALHYSVRKRYIEIFKLLLEHEKIDVNALSSSDIDFAKKTVLHLAVEKENIQVINLLLKRKDINVNIRSFSVDLKATPLYFVVKDNKINIVKLLLQHENIDINILNEESDRDNHSKIESVLFTAYENKYSDILHLLLFHKGCDIVLKKLFLLKKNILMI